MRKHSIKNRISAFLAAAALIFSGCSTADVNEWVEEIKEQIAGDGGETAETTEIQNIDINISDDTEENPDNNEDETAETETTDASLIVDEDTEEEKVFSLSFSEPSGLYKGAQSVSITVENAPGNGSGIFYTLDGNDPTYSSTHYDGAVELPCDEDVNVYTLKAVAYCGGEISEIKTEIFYIYKEEKSISDIDIICLSSDEEGLYSYDTGIMVAGKSYDEDEKNGELTAVSGNYSERGEEWRRSAHMSMFTPEGEVLIDKDVQMGISGNTSAVLVIKSFNIWSGDDTISLDCYDYDSTLSNYSYVTDYKKLTLRGGSQDTVGGNIRSAVVSRLCEAAGFEGCTETHRAILYLNNEFYGIYDIQQSYSDGFITKRFGLDDSDKIEKHKGSEDMTFTETGISGLIRTNLDDAANREALEKVVDMDDMLLYYGINLFCNNCDWPQNNMEIWRYTGEYVEGNEYTDGRWRFLEYDTDVTFQSEVSELFFPESKGECLVYMMNKTCFRNMSAFLYVLNSEYYRNRFLVLMKQLFQDTFTQENLAQIVDEEAETIKNATMNYCLPVQINNYNVQIPALRATVLGRQAVMESLFKTYFNVDPNKTYKVILAGTPGVTYSINGRELAEGATETLDLYVGTHIYVTAQAGPGTEITEITLDGEKKTGNIYIGSSAEAGDVFVVKTSTKKCEDVVIDMVYSYGDGDYIDIYNAGTEAVDLTGYYLSDDAGDPYKYELSGMLGAGHCFRLYGADNVNADDNRLNFNVGACETIYLIGDKGIADSVYVPRLDKCEAYGREGHGGQWKYIKVE